MLIEQEDSANMLFEQAGVPSQGSDRHLTLQVYRERD
jgi:hypothetical protein